MLQLPRFLRVEQVFAAAHGFGTHVWSLLLIVSCALMGSVCVSVTSAQDDVNYDEAKVPAFTLPDPLVCQDGSQVTTAEQWREVRRPELFALFESQMFGRAPQKPAALHWEVFEQSDSALDGTAIRKQVTIYFAEDKAGPRMDLLLYLPKSAAAQSVPVYLGLNFNGNHTITTDPAVRLATVWQRDRPNQAAIAGEDTRGSAASRWPVAEIVQRGYGVGVIYYGDIDPDFDDGFQNGVHALYHAGDKPRPAANDWGSIATWAWGLSCALDYLQTDEHVSGDRVAVVGHSRLGKTALWAGAADERFALVISNDSGCGGAALSRRRYGEKVKRINTSFPHWFCDNFLQYNDNEPQLPFDQHELIALMAPRPVVVCSAVDDRWADPRGEFLAAKLASPVYALFGYRGIEQDDLPATNQLVGDRIGYQIRPGKHDMTDIDWHAYLEFGDRYLNK